MELRKLHDEELNDMYLSPNIVRVIRSRKNRWTVPVARIGERSGICRVLVGKPEGKRPLWRPSIDGRIILIWIFSKWDVGYGLDQAGSGWEQVAGTCECRNKPSGPMKWGEFLD